MALFNKKDIHYEVKPETGMIKVSIACGQRKPEGFIGLDIAPIEGVDIVCDLLKFPWPLDDECADEVSCEHFYEHIPAELRPAFANELYRIMRKDGICKLVFPSGTSNRAFQDITHQWPPVVPQHFYYWNKGWREHEKLTHGPYAEWKCDFTFSCTGLQHEDFQSRSDEVMRFAELHYWGAMTDYQVILTKE